MIYFTSCVKRYDDGGKTIEPNASDAEGFFDSAPDLEIERRRFPKKKSVGCSAQNDELLWVRLPNGLGGGDAWRSPPR